MLISLLEPSRHLADTRALCAAYDLVIHSLDFVSFQLIDLYTANSVMAVFVGVISFLPEHWIQERSLCFYRLQTPSDPVNEIKAICLSNTALIQCQGHN